MQTGPRTWQGEDTIAGVAALLDVPIYYMKEQLMKDTDFYPHLVAMERGRLHLPPEERQNKAVHGECVLCSGEWSRWMGENISFERLVDEIEESRTNPDAPNAILIRHVGGVHYEAYVPEDPELLPQWKRSVVLPMQGLVTGPESAGARTLQKKLLSARDSPAKPVGKDNRGGGSPRGKQQGTLAKVAPPTAAPHKAADVKIKKEVVEVGLGPASDVDSPLSKLGRRGRSAAEDLPPADGKNNKKLKVGGGRSGAGEMRCAARAWLCNKGW